MLGPALGIAFVGYTDNILTGRAFAARNHETVEPQTRARRPRRGQRSARG